VDEVIGRKMTEDIKEEEMPRKKVLQVPKSVGKWQRCPRKKRKGKE
jgi:hypothetical protein